MVFFKSLFPVLSIRKNSLENLKHSSINTDNARNVNEKIIIIKDEGKEENYIACDNYSTRHKEPFYRAAHQLNKLKNRLRA